MAQLYLKSTFTGLDISEEVCAEAQARADKLSLSNIRFLLERHDYVSSSIVYAIFLHWLHVFPSPPSTELQPIYHWNPRSPPYRLDKKLDWLCLHFECVPCPQKPVDRHQDHHIELIVT